VTGRQGRRAFANALRTRLTPEARAAIAAALEVTPAMVSNWATEKTEPRPEQVFVMEAEMGLPPGALAHHLGYVPVDCVSVLAAIESDGRLSPRDRNALSTLYLSMASDVES
jgi:hypothetical protein